MEPTLEKRVGERIAAYRRAAKLTQEALAEQVRVAPETISRLERGVTVPSITTLESIGRALNLKLGELFDFGEKMSQEEQAVEALMLEVRQGNSEEIELIHELAKKVLEHGKRPKKARRR